MKPFKSYAAYLTENQKSYSWKIRLAQDVTECEIDCIENALKAYDLVSLSKPKSLPIQENPLGFEKLGAVPVMVMDAIIKYPTNEQQLRQIIARALNISGTHVSVASETAIQGFPVDYMRTIENKEKGPLLEKDYPKNEANSKEIYGDENIRITLKNLDSKTDKQTFAGPKEPKARTLNDIPQGKMSPIGSHQNKIPDPRKPFKR